MKYPIDIPVVSLQIGKVIVTKENVIIRTILGSCVSVVMFVPSKGLGIICHSIYPGRAETPDMKYTVDAIAQMDRVIRESGIAPQDVVVKLFGGGLQLIRSEHELTGSVQSENVPSAIEELKSQGYTVSAQNVGGYCSREVRFYTETGDVLLKCTRC